jgi:hypothetical protein
MIFSCECDLPFIFNSKVGVINSGHTRSTMNQAKGIRGQIDPFYGSKKMDCEPIGIKVK